MGQTIQPPRERLSKHRYSAIKRLDRSHLGKWFRSLIRQGMLPGMCVWERADRSALDSREKFWIAGFKENGFRLVNHRAGGSHTYPKGTGKGRVVSEETRHKISVANRGRKQSPETVQKRVAKNRGQKRSAEAIAATAAANRGRKMTDEQRARMSEAQRIRPGHSEETKRKMSEASSKLTPQAVWEIKELLWVGRLKQKDIAALYEVSPSSIAAINQGRTWKHILLFQNEPWPPTFSPR